MRRAGRKHGRGDSSKTQRHTSPADGGRSYLAPQEDGVAILPTAAVDQGACPTRRSGPRTPPAPDVNGTPAGAIGRALQCGKSRRCRGGAQKPGNSAVAIPRRDGALPARRPVVGRADPRGTIPARGAYRAASPWRSAWRATGSPPPCRGRFGISRICLPSQLRLRSRQHQQPISELGVPLPKLEDIS